MSSERPKTWDGCDRCGRTHRAVDGTGGGRPCHGHLSQLHPRDPGGPCGRRAAEGQDICDKHGAKAPQNITKAQRSIAETNARKMLHALVPDNPEPVRDPIAVLARLAGEADAVRGVAADKLRTMPVDTVDDAYELLAIATWYERMFDRTVRTCESLVKSNYLERQQAIDAARAAALISVIGGGLRLISDPTERDAVKAAIVQGIRELEAS